jgi:phosphate transport system substrate-binding protein
VSKKLKIEFSPAAKEMNGNAQILQGVRMDVSGIGYVGAGYLLHTGSQAGQVKVLKIKEKANMPGVSPLDETAIKAGRYYFQRPLYQFIPARSWNKVSAFIAFEQSTLGQQLITASGYYIVKQN